MAELDDSPYSPILETTDFILKPEKLDFGYQATWISEWVAIDQWWTETPVKTAFRVYQLWNKLYTFRLRPDDSVWRICAVEPIENYQQHVFKFI